ncbi:MAG: DUF255 domain-containing protein [Sulfurovum sp.]|nr:DUF255 domain-containing protein [Sulfurovum sp.]
MKTNSLFLFYCLVLLSFLLGCSEKNEHKAESTLKISSQTIDKPIKEETTKTIAGLRWYLNIEESLKIAKRLKKNIIVMVGEESCRWCKKMKERTLTDKRIQEKLKSYILVSVKRSDKDAIKHLDTFDGNIPSFFFMEKDKEIIDSIVGYFKADDFLEYLNEIEE